MQNCIFQSSPRSPIRRSSPFPITGSLAHSLAHARHHHPQARIRRRAAWVANASLRWLDEAAQQEAIPLLVPLLHDPDHKVRDAAQKAFRRLHDLLRPRSVVKTILEGCLNHLRHSALPWVPLSHTHCLSDGGLIIGLINRFIDVLELSMYIYIFYKTSRTCCVCLTGLPG